MNKQKLWTKDFLVISLINFFLMLVMYLLIVTIAPFAVKEYGASTSLAGLVSGIFIIGTLFARIGTGRLLGKMSSKKILLFGLAITFIATIFYFGATNMTLLLANRLFHGIGLGIASTATGTMVVQMIPSSRRGEGIGYFSMSTVLATAIGPFMGIFLSQHYEFSVLFILCSILSLISLGIFFLVKEPIQLSSSKERKKSKKKFNLSNFIEKKSLPISFITLFVALSYSGVLSFISFYAAEINLVKSASFFFLVYAIAVLLSRPFSGRLLDKRGAKFVVYPALFSFAIGLILLSTAQSGFMLLLAGAIIGLGFGNFQSCAQAIALKHIPIERIGIATSTFFIFLDFGFGFGPYFLGILAPIIGYHGMYLGLSFVVIATLIAFGLVFRTKKVQRTIKSIR